MDANELVQMVVRARAGDKNAFNCLYLHFGQMVLCYLIRMGFKQYDAEDLCQEVFVQAWMKLAQLEDPVAFRAWLLTITRRRGINAAKRGVRYVTSEFIDLCPSPDGDVSKPVEQIERKERVGCALRVLKPLDRETLLAFYWRGRSLREMAEEFDAPVGTIKRRLHVARKRLGKALEMQNNGVNGNGR